MIVTAPGLRWEPSKGVYCFTLRYNVSSGLSNNALRYSRIYCPSTVCSFMRKFTVDIVATKCGRRKERVVYIYGLKDKRTLYNEKLRRINIWNGQLFIYIQTNDISRPGYTIFVQPLVQSDVASLRLVVYSITTMVGIGPHVFGCVIYFW